MGSARRRDRRSLIDFDRWCALSGPMAVAGETEWEALLAEAGLSAAEWDRADEHWKAEIVLDLIFHRLDRPTKLAQSHADARKQPPRSPARTSPRAFTMIAPPRAAPAVSSSLGLPFQASPAGCAPEGRFAPPLQRASVGTGTIDPRMLAARGEDPLPFSASPMPVACNAHTTLSLDRYARLCAQIQRCPGEASRIGASFGLKDADALRREHEAWRSQFHRDAGVQSLWAEMKARYFAQQEGGAQR